MCGLKRVQYLSYLGFNRCHLSPMKINGITMLDFALLIVSMLLLWVFSYTKYTIKRWEGLVLIGVFFAYMSYLFMHI